MRPPSASTRNAEGSPRIACPRCGRSSIRRRPSRGRGRNTPHPGASRHPLPVGEGSRGAVLPRGLTLSAPAVITLPAITPISAIFAGRAVGARRSGGSQLLFRRWRKQRLARESNLAGLRLDRDHLHLDFIAELEKIRHLADARVRHLRDVQQSVLTGKDLDERAVRLDALDRSL